MRCSNCDLPLPSGPPQTCPRCYTVNRESESAADAPRVSRKRKRPLRKRTAITAPLPLESDSNIKKNDDEPASE